MSYEYQAGPWSPYYYTGANMTSITVHHAAGTSFDAIGNTFQHSHTSAHYGVAPGKVAQYVSEDHGAWHCGASGNMTSIGIECVNSSGDPYWGVAEETVQTLCELMADIAIRNGFYPLKRGVNVFGHKDWSATYCPGVLYDRLDEICERANKIIEGDNSVDDVQESEDDMSNYCKYRAYEEYIKGLYVGLLRREADFAGLMSHVGNAIGGASMYDVAHSIMLSDEWQAMNLGPEERIKDMYIAVLGREADEAGLNSWVDVAVETGDLVKVLDGIYGSKESADRMAAMGI